MDTKKQPLANSVDATYVSSHLLAKIKINMTIAATNN